MRLRTLARPEDRADILRRLRTVRPDGAARWGRMSAHQMICHLSDAFRMAMGEMPVRPTGSLLHRTMLCWVVLYVPVRWPAGIPTSPELDQVAGRGTSPSVFAADVAHLEAMVGTVSAAVRAFDWQAHPLFGRLSPAAWLRWGYLHMDHHLRQFGV